MSRINIKKDVKNIEPIGYFLLDGQIVDKVSVEKIRSSKFTKSWYCVYSDAPTSSEEIASLKKNEFIEAKIYVLIFKNWTEIGIYSVNIRFEIDTKDIRKNLLKFELWADLLLWNRNYTFIDYLQEFEHLLNSNKIGVLISDDIGSVIKIRIETFSENNVISAEINNCLKKIIELHYETLNNLDAQHNKNSILASFNFPEEIKISCEQYLFYFATFLKDLIGIDATSNLKEEAGKVLFSVTPTDDIEALDKIREALAVYLKLPESPIVYDDSFAAMRLQQQIENLQHSQRMAVREIRTSERELRLAQTVIEKQDEVIQQKDTLIEQQNKIIEKIISPSIMMDSVENKKELEKVFEGLEVGESKWLYESTGIKLNPVKLLETLGKKLVGKDDEITSLNLNDEAVKDD